MNQTIISQADLRRAVRDASHETVELGSDTTDVESFSREREIDQQLKLLLIDQPRSGNYRKEAM